MPTPRKTIAQLAKSGGLRKNPGRYRARIDAQNYPHPPIGGAPKHLSAGQRGIWAEFVRQSAPGSLAKHDRFLVELLVILIDKMRSGTAKSSELTAISTLMKQLSSTPLSRATTDLPPSPSAAEINAKAEEDEMWAEFEN